MGAFFNYKSKFFRYDDLWILLTLLCKIYISMLLFYYYFLKFYFLLIFIFVIFTVSFFEILIFFVSHVFLPSESP